MNTTDHQYLKGVFANGGWLRCQFVNTDISCYVPPKDLWNVYMKSPEPNETYVCALVSDDSPYRWLKLSETQN